MAKAAKGKKSGGKKKKGTHRDSKNDMHAPRKGDSK